MGLTFLLFISFVFLYDSEIECTVRRLPFSVDKLFLLTVQYGQGCVDEHDCKPEHTYIY